MKNYIVYKQNGTILRTGVCRNDTFEEQSCYPGEKVAEGTANDIRQKVVEENGNPTVVDKTEAEILRDNPPPPVIPDEDKPARFSKKQLQQLEDRIAALESRS